MRQPTWLGVFVCLAIGSGPAVANPVLRVCTALNPPFTVVSGETITGTHTAFFRAALDRIGVNATITAVPWSRCLDDLKMGLFDVAYSASYRETRAEFSHYVWPPIEAIAWVILVRKGTPHEWDHRRDLTTLPQPIASPSGYSNTAELKKIPGLRVDGSGRSTENNVRKLMANRVGSVVVSDREAAAILRTPSYTNALEQLAEPWKDASGQHTLVSKRYGQADEGERLATRLGEAFAELHQARGLDQPSP